MDGPYDRGVSETEDRAELFLVDGNSLAYRAFFALPDTMATSDGRPTNAIFGLASMLVKLISEHRPRQIVVVWDAGMSGREEVYPEYKSHRPSRPDLLKEQWPELLRLVEAFGYLNVSVDGYEADDVIATLATSAAEEGVDTIVVTGDRDAFQLVGERIKVMSTTKGISETVLYDEEGVFGKYGVRPDQVTDLIGLRGDTSDNIPGVPGIGEKTAAALLSEFGTLEEVLANVENVSGAKRKENLTEHAEDARVSKRLATMVTDLDPGVGIDEILEREVDRSGVRDFMLGFELKAALERLEKALGPEEIPGAGPSESTERIEVEVSDGGIGDLDGGSIAIAADGGWAATDGQKVIAGSGSISDHTGDLEGLSLTTHDAKAVLGGRGGVFDKAAANGTGIDLAFGPLDLLTRERPIETDHVGGVLGDTRFVLGESTSAEDDDRHEHDDGDESLTGHVEGSAPVDATGDEQADGQIDHRAHAASPVRGIGDGRQVRCHGEEPHHSGDDERPM